MYDHHVTEAAARPGAVQDGPIVKPLPADEFRVYGSNAEMRWEVMREHGYVVPNANFFVRNHTTTPLARGHPPRPRRPGRLAAVGIPVADPRPGVPYAAGPGYRRHRRHPVGRRHR
jgi:hypothetical protein